MPQYESGTFCPTCNTLSFNEARSGCDSPWCESWHGDPRPYALGLAQTKFELEHPRVSWADLSFHAKMDALDDVLRLVGYEV